MKKIYITLLSVLAFGTGFSQITEKEDDLKKVETDTIVGWKTSAVINLNVAQTSLTNWAAGGQNSIALNSLGSFQADYKNSKFSWDNTLDLGYGILRQGKEDNVSTQKTDDKIDFASKYGKKIKKNLYAAGLINFKTQFAAGYNYPNDSVVISDLLAPAYFLTALGLDYKPTSKLSIFAAPFTGKVTIVNNETLADAGAFGVEPAFFDQTGTLTTHGEHTKTEFGGYIKIAYANDIMKNVKLNTKLDLFSNYLNNPGNIDINWETLINFKVNKYISMSLSTQLLYDDDVKIEIDEDGDGTFDSKGSRIQFKELFGFGITYKL
ncbi:MAG: DUF3078 domain-containing protein [Bacteroidota bacterium]|nr:DUF3078 domain-containing protein [Bacteroidota bacterium]